MVIGTRGDQDARAFAETVRVIVADLHPALGDGFSGWRGIQA